MPNKCCVAFCKGNYDSENEIKTVFRFPKNVEEREKWRLALPNVIKVRYTVLIIHNLLLSLHLTKHCFLFITQLL